MPTPTVARTRLESIDLLRGIVMILMALDHVRDFFGGLGPSPTDVAHAGAALFLTRWITNLCAPVFFLLTGTGARLALRRRSKRNLAEFLVTRGLWLIFLEVVLLRCLAWQFNFDFRLIMLVVLWALGWAMIALAPLIFLPDWCIVAFGVGMIALHNLFDSVTAASLGSLAPLWTILHAPGFLLNTPQHEIFVAYPLVPWIGVTAAGYGLGRIYERPAEGWSAEKRRGALLRLGLLGSAAFVLLRALNLYGDPAPWSRQSTGVHTVLSFLNTSKYPPSLLFLLMTLGPALCLLWLFDRGTPRWLRPALVYGRVPLFYFGLHAALIHLLALAVCLVRYGQVHWIFESPTVAQFPFTRPPGWGFSLPVTYLIWAFVVVALYPLCRWFADLKQRRRDAWLSYL